MYAFMFSPIHATCPIYLIHFDLIITIKLTETLNNNRIFSRQSFGSNIFREM
jgi:hypothetical protein